MKRTDLESSIALDHLHRYTYAAQLVGGKQVIDLLSHEGYGAAILAKNAKFVTGLDPDEVVVQQAHAKHKRDNLKFVVGSVSSLPISDDQTFDAVIGFDWFQETTDPQRFLTAVRRLLSPGGLFITSAPVGPSEEDAQGLKAFTSEEFHRLLSSSFAYSRILNQTVSASSIIQPEKASTNGNAPEKRESQYVIAVASDSAVPDLETSTLSDPIHVLLRNKDKAIRELLDMKAYQDETLKRQERQLAERKQTVATLEEAFAWHTSQIDALKKTQAYHESEIEQLRRTLAADRDGLAWRTSEAEEFQRAIASREEGLAWRASQVETLEREAEGLRQRVQKAETDLANVRSELDAIHASRGWKLILRARSLQAALFKWWR
jgi:ubiquinone/menaquinone biosynthesis C-methylase UbiE